MTAGCADKDSESEHFQMIEDCEARESKLTNWERNFVTDIRRGMGGNRGLTPKQAETLEKIWERVT